MLETTRWQRAAHLTMRSHPRRAVCCKRKLYKADAWCATRYPGIEEAKLPAKANKKRSPPAPPLAPPPPGPCSTSKDSLGKAGRLLMQTQLQVLWS